MIESRVPTKFIGLPIAFYVLASFVFPFPETAYSWLLEDYTSRIVVLALVFGIPSLRLMILAEYRKPWPGLGAFPPVWLMLLTYVGLLLFFDKLVFILVWPIDVMFSETILFDYHEIEETWLLFFDLTVGLALVAVSEEIIYKGLMKPIAARILDRSWFIVVLSGVFFGLMHWPGGVGKVIAVTLIGMAGMVLYLYARSLWPTTIAHYFSNLIFFWPD